MHMPFGFFVKPHVWLSNGWRQGAKSPRQFYGKYQFQGVGRRCWEKGAGVYCVFLPSCAVSSEIYLDGEAQSGLEFAGKTFHVGDKLEGISLNQKYKVSFYNVGMQTEGTLIFMTAKNLPMIYINMRSGSLEKVDSDKEYKESGYIRIVSENGKELYTGGIKKLTGRGNTSWEIPKKSYALELDNAASVFGMRERKRWILTANYYDGSYLRNWLGFRIAKDSGLRGVTDNVFADLYVDGEYRGLYQLTERIESDSGYLMEIDYPERAAEEENVLYLKNGQPIVLHSPKKVVQGQKDILNDYFAQIEETLYASDYICEKTGKPIFDFLDEESFALMYLLEELYMNLDMGVTSQYLYWSGEKDEPLYDGPVWDLDNSMGRSNYSDGELILDQCDLSSNLMARCYARLWGNDKFREDIGRMWEEKVLPSLMSAEGEIDVCIERIYPSIVMDQCRWPEPRSVIMTGADLETNIAYLKEYLEKRRIFLNGVFIEKPQEIYSRREEQAAVLPELKEIKEDTGTGEGHGDLANDRFSIMGYHGEFCISVVLIILSILFLVDHKRNHN